jgi:hypothetical protein
MNEHDNGINEQFDLHQTNSDDNRDREHESLDALWYERYKKYGSWAGFEHLGGTKEVRDRAKADFLLIILKIQPLITQN